VRLEPPDSDFQPREGTKQLSNMLRKAMEIDCVVGCGPKLAKQLMEPALFVTIKVVQKWIIRPPPSRLGRVGLGMMTADSDIEKESSSAHSRTP
jgi:hypothetical protein